MEKIVLCTVNARYIHASLGLRYLLANMHELREQTQIKEFTSEQRAEDIAETLLNTNASIIGFGVYIWNTTITQEIVKVIKLIRPDIKIVLGGPEVSFEQIEQPLNKLADFTISGQADEAFYELCCEILAGKTPQKFVTSLPVKLNELESPYPYYSDEDIKNRVLYVEASRGCPFKCEFCLSSLDKTAIPFDVDIFLKHIQALIDRGARQFKFVDRTFNLKIASSDQILNFFLKHVEAGVDIHIHFELIPDRLPDALKSLIVKFPENTLQFEIGIQSFNPNVQQLISRRQDHEKTCSNLKWLKENSAAHIHADLIFGLPSEDLASCAHSFDLLYSLRPDEIQVGILKRLRGTPIIRHTETYELRFSTTPPYRIMQTSTIGYDEMQQLVRFARYWDIVANSGRFPATLPLLLQSTPFSEFYKFSNWLYLRTGQTHAIALPKLFNHLYQYLSETDIADNMVTSALLSDFEHNKLKGTPAFLNSKQRLTNQSTGVFRRQKRHSKDSIPNMS